MKGLVKSFGQFNESFRNSQAEWYYGIADCKGLESFMKAPSDVEMEVATELLDMGIISKEDSDSVTKEFNQTISMMAMRCQFNAQRHAVVYMAKLDKEWAEEIDELMRTGDYEEALVYLKQAAYEVKLARGRGVNAERSWNKIPNPDLDPMSESLLYHINEGLSIAESVYRPASQAHFELLAEARTAYDRGEIELTGIDQILFEETDLGRFGEYRGEIVPLDFLFEAEYKGKKVEIGKPMRGGTKKYHVYVINPKTKRVKKIAFGDVHGGLTAKVSNPKARKSFAARHQCHLKNDRTKAGYWACRINRYAHLWGGKTYPGFW
jgi:hypothetical protein